MDQSDREDGGLQAFCLPWPVLISLDQCWLILILILYPRSWSVFERCFGQIRSMLKGLDHFGTLEPKWFGLRPDLVQGRASPNYWSGFPQLIGSQSLMLSWCVCFLRHLPSLSSPNSCRHYFWQEGNLCQKHCFLLQ